MFTDILRQHRLTEEKRAEFLETMASQINKLEFLMQSLIKMSRLETGTFVLHMEEAPLEKTIAQAISTVWAKADRKNIQLSADCAPSITVQHDPKWTAEALGNILDNGVKYTPVLTAQAAKAQQHGSASSRSADLLLPHTLGEPVHPGSLLPRPADRKSVV